MYNPPINASNPSANSFGPFFSYANHKFLYKEILGLKLLMNSHTSADNLYNSLWAPNDIYILLNVSVDNKDTLILWKINGFNYY